MFWKLTFLMTKIKIIEANLNCYIMKRKLLLKEIKSLVVN